MEAVELGEAAAEGGDGSPATPALTRQRSAHGAEYEVLLAKGVPRHMLSRAWVVCAGDAADAEMCVLQQLCALHIHLCTFFSEELLASTRPPVVAELLLRLSRVRFAVPKLRSSVAAFFFRAPREAILS